MKKKSLVTLVVEKEIMFRSSSFVTTRVSRNGLFNEGFLENATDRNSLFSWLTFFVLRVGHLLDGAFQCGERFGDFACGVVLSGSSFAASGCARENHFVLL